VKGSDLLRAPGEPRIAPLPFEAQSIWTPRRAIDSQRRQLRQPITTIPEDWTLAAKTLPLGGRWSGTPFCNSLRRPGECGG